MKETLRELTSFVGPSGFEHDVARYVYNRLKDKVDECYVDRFGDVIAICKGANEGPTLLVSAHSDQVGFIVKRVEPNGLIRFEKLGGHDDRVLLAQRILIRTEKGTVNGIIGTLSCHMMKYEDPTLVRKHSELYIDVGVSTAEEVEELGIQPGDPITYATELEEFGKNRVIGRGFDDRAGCTVLIKAIEETDFSKVNGTVYFSFSAQEEVGLRGARVASQQVNADVAIAVDTTPSSDTPEPMMDKAIIIGKGPAIKVMDWSYIANTKVRDKLRSIAKEMGMPYQMEVFPGIGTDAGELCKEKAGVPTGGISIPSRYTHSPIETLDLDDLENAKELLKKFILDMKTKDEFSFI